MPSLSLAIQSLRSFGTDTNSPELVVRFQVIPEHAALAEIYDDYPGCAEVWLDTDHLRQLVSEIGQVGEWEKENPTLFRATFLESQRLRILDAPYPDEDWAVDPEGGGREGEQMYPLGMELRYVQTGSVMWRGMTKYDEYDVRTAELYKEDLRLLLCAFVPEEELAGEFMELFREFPKAAVEALQNGIRVPGVPDEQVRRPVMNEELTTALLSSGDQSVREAAFHALGDPPGLDGPKVGNEASEPEGPAES